MPIGLPFLCPLPCAFPCQFLCPFPSPFLCPFPCLFLWPISSLFLVYFPPHCQCSNPPSWMSDTIACFDSCFSDFCHFLVKWCCDVGVSGFFALPEHERPICVSAFFLLLSSSADVLAKAASNSVPTKAKLVLGRETLSVEDLLSLPRLGRGEKNAGCYLSLSTKPAETTSSSSSISSSATRIPLGYTTTMLQQQCVEVGLYGGSTAPRPAGSRGEQVSTRRFVRRGSASRQRATKRASTMPSPGETVSKPSSLSSP